MKLPIPSRTNWVKWRDAAGVPKSFSKHDMAPALEKYLAVEQNGSFKERYIAATSLRETCLKYYSDLKNSKDKKTRELAAILESKVIRELTKTEALHRKMASPMLELKAQLKRLIQSVGTVKDSATWSSWWEGPICGIGTTRKGLRNVLSSKEMQAFEAAFPERIISRAFLSQGRADAKAMAVCVKQVLLHAKELNSAAHQYGWW